MKAVEISRKYVTVIASGAKQSRKSGSNVTIEIASSKTPRNDIDWPSVSLLFGLRFLLPAALVFMTINVATAQTDTPLRQRFGLFGDLNLNMHTADFQQLPGLDNCSPGFRSGFGLAPTFGALYELLLSGPWMLGLRATYTSQSAMLHRDEGSSVEIDGDAVPITIEHSIDASLASLGLDPLVSYHLNGAFSLTAGMHVGYLLTKKYAQLEKLSDAETRGKFENGRRTRNESSGALPGAASIEAAALAGVSYELPLNPSGTMLAAPELMLSFGLTPLVDGISWNAHSLRAGIALKYAPLPSVEPPPPPAQPKPPVLAGTIKATGVTADGTEEPVARLRVEEFISNEMHPLLSYIFFDDKSATLPSRYLQLSREESMRFDRSALHGLGRLEVYHRLLNIIGDRLRQHPDATLRLVGTTSGRGAEANNRELSRHRAEAVRNYLRDTWGIAESRLRIEATDLPAKPSNPSDPDGIEENRRVEIYTDDNAILAPVEASDTVRHTTPPIVRFRSTVQSEAGVRDWHISAWQDGQLLKEFSGSGSVPEQLDWPLDHEQPTVPKAPGVVHYELNVSDVAGGQYRTGMEQLPVEQVTVRKKRHDRIADVAIERYSLILFDYDEAGLTAEQRTMIDSVRKRIGPESTVRVVGYADRTGASSHNGRLALDRAQAVSTALGVSGEQVEVRGETTPLYDNTLPEGRLNSRTVTIEIKTPVVDGDSG